MPYDTVCEFLVQIRIANGEPSGSVQLCGLTGLDQVFLCNPLNIR